MTTISILKQFSASSTGAPIGLGYSSASNELLTYGSNRSTVERYSEGGTFLGSFANPAAGANDYDIEVISQPLTLNGTALAAGTALLLNGDTGTISAVHPTSGAVLATLNTGVSAGDIVGLAVHPPRGTLFMMKYGNDTVFEVDPGTGAVKNSFSVGALGFDVFYGDLDVDPVSGDLFVVSSTHAQVLRIKPTGELVEKIALPGGITGVSGLAFDDETPGVAHVVTIGGSIFTLSNLIDAGVTITGTAGNDVIQPGKVPAGQLQPTVNADTLLGLGGNDLLDGGLGGDRMEGGAGNDTYIVENANDLVVEAAGAGTDTVTASVSHTLADNVENLTLTGSLIIDGTGNAANNKIVGNGAANTLKGLAGNDQLDGGAGADRLEGGLGNDIYTVDNAGDLVVEDAGKAAGIDTVKASVSYTLGANVEKLTLLGNANLTGTGNELNNTLVGNSGANTLIGLGGNDVLDGKGGADRMEGGLGNDTYIVDNASDQTVEAVGGGIDTVKSAIGGVLQANVENLILTGKLGVNGNGNDLGNKMTGNTGNNTLHGFADNDTVLGGAGDDILYGEEGADQLTGGIGADQLFGGTGADKFIFLAHTETGVNGADVIHDFSQLELDRIDLSKIDADTFGASNQAFTFIGTDAFSGGGAAGAGQLRYTQAAGVTTVTGDLNGDGVADFAIKLIGTINLTGGDFVL